MPEPAAWAPKTEYLVASPEHQRADSSVPAFASVKEAQRLVKYWATLVPGSPCCIVEAVTHYRVIGGPAGSGADQRASVEGVVA